MTPVMRFVCDEMLRGLGRWLCAAGYDTAIAEGGLPDRILAARCRGRPHLADERWAFRRNGGERNLGRAHSWCWSWRKCGVLGLCVGDRLAACAVYPLHR
jgi:hypothetical protein